MKRRVLTAVLAFMMVFAYMPLLPYSQVYATDGDELSDIEMELKEAQLDVQAKEENLEEAQAALAEAQAALDAAGRDFLNEKAGANANIDKMVEVFGADSELSGYVNSETFTKALAAGLTVDNLLKAADFVVKCNDLRADHGLDPLKINYRLMCLAAVSAAISSDYSAGHALFVRYNGAFGSYFEEALPSYQAENLAWGYSNPFAGWYTAEKEAFNKAVKEYPELENKTPSQITSLSNYGEIRNKYKFGHYLNIIDGNRTITGFSRNSSADEQCFGSGDYGESVTPEKFKAALNDYEAGLQAEVDEAAKGVKHAKNELAQAKARLKEAKDACAKAGHEYGAWKVTKKATCKEKGAKERVCASCKYKDTAVIPVDAGNHVHTKNVAAVKATLKADGKKAAVVCTDCGKILSGGVVIPKVSSIKLGKTEYVYSGKARKPAVTVKAGSKTLKNGTDYTVQYSNITKVGKAKVVVKGKGQYSFTKTLTFKINPKGTSLTSVSALRKGFKVKWKKQATQTSGYQIYYTTSTKAPTKATKPKVTITKTGTISKKITKLKAGQKYFVYVRTYKKVNGVKYYSKWSATKTVTTKE